VPVPVSGWVLRSRGRGRTVPLDLSIDLAQAGRAVPSRPDQAATRPVSTPGSDTDHLLEQASFATRDRTGRWDGVHRFSPRTEGRCRNVAIRRAHFLDRKRRTSICDV